MSIIVLLTRNSLNNRDDKGSFAVAFAKGDNVTVAPVMSLMGKKGEAWGGPITVATDDLPDGAVKTLNLRGFLLFAVTRLPCF